MDGRLILLDFHPKVTLAFLRSRSNSTYPLGEGCHLYFSEYVVRVESPVDRICQLLLEKIMIFLYIIVKSGNHGLDLLHQGLL